MEWNDARKNLETTEATTWSHGTRKTMGYSGVRMVKKSDRDGKIRGLPKFQLKEI